MAWIPYVALGLVPSGLFFVWVERNLAIPWLSFAVDLPWLRTDWELPAALAFDAMLFALFGFTHSALARPRLLARAAQAFRIGDNKAIQRRFYVTVTGLSLSVLMAFWQPTGRVAWLLPLPWTWLQALSLALYLGSLGVGAWIIRAHGMGGFLGVPQASEAARPAALQATGLYRHVRHPLYLSLIVAFLATPMMSLDRLWLTGCLCAYLAIAIPLEEGKLIEELGPGYLDYRERVPALVPFFKGRSAYPGSGNNG